MRKSSPFPFLPDLERPLRDALRGGTSLADATEEALEPAAKLRPEPLRAGLRRVIRTVERAGKRQMNAPVASAHL